jgi:outer membrane protein TolC
MFAFGIIIATALRTSASVDTTTLDSLIALAQRRNPDVRAATARVDAASARIGPAGARPDPMLMVGVQDVPYRMPGYADDFTMNVVRVTQTVPFPGKLGLAVRAAAGEADAARASTEQARLDVARDVRKAYYELAYTQRARDIIARNQSVLTSLLQASQVRYEVGSGTQADVLRARVEITRLGDEAAVLAADARAARARLNAILDQPSETPIDSATIPASIVRLAVADSATHVHFASAALGAPPADSPLPSGDSLQGLAIAHSPMLRAHGARIGAQERMLALARKASLPDFDVSVEYDQRPHFPDFLSAFVSIPVPLQKGRKQNEEVVAAQSELTALHAEHAADVAALRAAVATLASDAERERTQLALDVAGVLPQARATLQSATASYAVGRVDFLTLMETQTALFSYELSYYRTLSEFATTLAELDRVVGTEVVR